MAESTDDAAADINGSNIENAEANAGLNRDASSLVDSSSKRTRRSVERTGIYVQSKPKKQRTAKKTKEAEGEFDTVWICVECKEAECMMEPAATELLICDSSCRRLFHYPCAGLDKLPSEDEKFICTDCKNQQHTCSICSNYGKDDEDVFKCRKNNCGLFFHESCLAMQNIEVEVVPDEEIKKNADNSTSHGDAAACVVSRRRFVCPAHSCWTCTQADLKEQEKSSKAASSVETKAKSNGKGKKKAFKLPGAFESKTEKFMTVSLSPRLFYFAALAVASI